MRLKSDCGIPSEISEDLEFSESLIDWGAPPLAPSLAQSESFFIIFLRSDSEEKHDPVSDIDIALVDSLKALDPKRPIREADMAKTRADTGSLYPSQHELLPLFKKGAAANLNNIALGKRGRHRTNLWTYPRASSVGSDARKGLQDHPTVKPTAMLQDALIDLTNPGEIVLDPFLGSGSSLIAAENTGRVCRGIELDPFYIDVIIRRYEAATGVAALLAEFGETFEKVATRRRMMRVTNATDFLRETGRGPQRERADDLAGAPMGRPR